MDVTPDRDALDRAKSALRLKARAARRAVLPEMRRAASYAIAERVLSLPVIDGASAALLYGASPEEADPLALENALRQRGVRIAYPRVAGPLALALHWVDDRTELTSGAYGLLEPRPETPGAEIADISFIIVPGVAFDPAGNRLGFGGGYYDALLGSGETMPPSIGIAYDEQVFETVPHRGRDHAVDFLVTPSRSIRCATSRP